MNLGQKALQILKTFAPTIALAVGGPVGPFAAAALHAVFGTTDDQSAEAALLTATPQQLADLRKTDNDFKLQMAKLGVDEDKMVFDDIANARAREIAIKDNTPKVLSYLTTAGFFTALIGAFLLTIPESSRAIVYSMIGALGTVWITQQGYYFGSSLGSSNKTDTLNKIATTATSATAAATPGK